MLPVIALVISGLTGWCLLGALRPPAASPRWALILLRLCLSFTLGLLVSSGVMFILRLSGARLAVWVPVGDTLTLTAAVGWLVLRRRAVSPKRAPEPGAAGAGGSPALPAPGVQTRSRLILVRAAMGVAGAAAVLGLACWAVMYRIAPHGFWDAWSIWNLKARFIFAGGTRWSALFSPVIDWSHPDYPLFLPLSVARLWCYLGTDAPWAPAMLSGLIAALILTTLFSTLALVKGTLPGALAGMALLGSTSFLYLGSLQGADPAVAVFLLAALAAAAAALAAAPVARTWLFIAGVMAGGAAWSKEEGLIVCAALVVAALVVGLAGGGPRRALRNCGWLLVGMAGPLSLVILQRLMFPARGYFLAEQTYTQLFAKLVDPHRHAILLSRAVLIYLPMYFISQPVLAALVLLGVSKGRSHDGGSRDLRRLAVIVPAIVLLGFYVAYIITPRDMSWHLRTSAERLLLQVWPAFLLAFFFWLEV